jgi:oligopeptide/dipeptide ABC transporter ATP-binding protein
MPLLEIRGMHKTFRTRPHPVLAVRGVDLDVEGGQTVGLVGESGSGKSTLARVIAGLSRATSGTVTFDGHDITEGITDRSLRRGIQMVFQDPSQSLNPRFTVERTVSEPGRLLGIAKGGVLKGLVDETLGSVGLEAGYLHRRPAQLSGGQQQRVAIARALICQPRLVVLDEPTSSLDQSIQARIVSLLKSIQEQQGLAYLFVSHDLRVIRTIAHRVAVMYAGRIVELAETEALFTSPQHPYTQALLSAIPGMAAETGQKRQVLPGETPSPSQLPEGCAFQNRCPWVHDRCYETQPSPEAYSEGHLVECFAVSAKEARSFGGS